MTDSRQERRLLDAACEIAREAGRAILDVYGRDDFAVSRKSDDSPLTEADLVAHGIISRALTKRGAKSFTAIADALPAETRMDVPKVCALIATRTGVSPEKIAAPRG
jgi:hypothetical protein